MWLAATIFYAAAKADLVRAHEYWNRFKPSAIIFNAKVFAAEAAIALLQQNVTEAVMKIDLAIAALPNMLDRGNALALRDKLIALKSNALK